MTLIIARKTITAVFGTMALQLIEIFQCSVTYSIKQTSAFFLTFALLSLILLCVTAVLLSTFSSIKHRKSLLFIFF